MALTELEKSTIRSGCSAAKLVLERLEPVLHSLNVIYDSAGGVKQTVDQAGLDEVGAYSGLTKQELDDGMYALTATLRVAISDAYTQLTKLAARA